MYTAALIVGMLLASITSVVRFEDQPAGVTRGFVSSNSVCGQVDSGQIKVTIASGGMPYKPAKDTFRVGEPIPLVITMTNTSNEPVYVCSSATLYQDRPQLLRDGQPVPYTSYRQSMIQVVQKDKTCQTINLPEQILLSPNKPTVVDYFNLAQGANLVLEDGWYEPLPAGNYTLTDQRLLNCCDGSFTKTNTIKFVVLP